MGVKGGFIQLILGWGGEGTLELAGSNSSSPVRPPVSRFDLIWGRAKILVLPRRNTTLGSSGGSTGSGRSNMVDSSLDQNFHTHRGPG